MIVAGLKVNPQEMSLSSYKQLKKKQTTLITHTHTQINNNTGSHKGVQLRAVMAYNHILGL